MDSSSIENLALFACSALLYEYLRLRRCKLEVEEAYWGERRGRARVEQEMRNLADIRLNTSEGFFVQPIATIESCYRQCVGTPRQGMLVPASRARAVLVTSMSPEALDGRQNVFPCLGILSSCLIHDFRLGTVLSRMAHFQIPHEH